MDTVRAGQLVGCVAVGAAVEPAVGVSVGEAVEVKVGVEVALAMVRVAPGAGSPEKFTAWPLVPEAPVTVEM